MTKQSNILKESRLDTPLGPMTAIADDYKLYLLEFADRPGLENKIERLKQKTDSAIEPGDTKPIDSIASELKNYFAGKLKTFKTPLCFLGSAFEQRVWHELQQVPQGETRSYSDIAHTVGKQNGHRAVAQANSANPLCIIVPCHRIIYTDGKLGGYAGGTKRKEWLINHERIEGPCG